MSIPTAGLDFFEYNFHVTTQNKVFLFYYILFFRT